MKRSAEWHVQTTCVYAVDAILMIRNYWALLMLLVRAQGMLLKAEDRAKFKKALQDLKDYEVYREVNGVDIFVMRLCLDSHDGPATCFLSAILIACRDHVPTVSLCVSMSN